jgi:hypothetical protein
VRRRDDVSGALTVGFSGDLGSQPIVTASHVDARRLDPFVVQVEGFFYSDAEEVVSRREIAALCGDADGCRLRLIFRYGGQHLHSPRPFATDPEEIDSWMEHADATREFRQGALDLLPGEIILYIERLGDLHLADCSGRKRITPIVEHQ